jgi:hypothetical protein
MNVLRRLALLNLLFVPLCVAQVTAPAATAPDQPIVTDRPSVATGTSLVPVDSLQFENGINWTRDQSANSADAPETELRYGLSPRFELEAFLPNANWGGGTDGVQFTDFALATKIRLVSDKKNWPVSIIGILTLPTGSQALTSGAPDPAILVAVQHNLPRNLQFVGNASLVSRSTNGSGRVAQSQLAFGLGWCANPRTCFYAEEAPFFSTAQDSSGNTIDGGMTYGVTTRTQIDCRIGTTSENGDHSFFATFGYSFRLDHFGRRKRSH